jgi:hypothetical protein
MSKKFLIFSMLLVSIFVCWCNNWNNSDESDDLGGQFATNWNTIWADKTDKVSVAEELNYDNTTWSTDTINSSEEL